MTRAAVLVVSVVAGVIAAAALPARLRATPPGGNGRIAYMVSDRRGHWQIWTANSDLSGKTKLTRGRADSGWAVWSPSGKRIAFDSDRSDRAPNDSKTVNDVFVMKSDGSGVRKLTDSKGASGDAAWSPDGSLIAYDSDRGNSHGYSSIYVIRASGGKPRRVTRPKAPFSDYAPRFSPDGTRIVFWRSRGTADHAPSALFMRRLDGRGAHRLTPFSLHVNDADWSPDGTRIVFEAYPDPGSYGDVYVINAAGGTPVDLTQNPLGQQGSSDPVWSPDGTTILFLDNRFVGGVGRTGLATMSPDGSNRQFVSSGNLEAHQPDWESLP